jgi:hypothetical protein
VVVLLVTRFVNIPCSIDDKVCEFIFCCFHVAYYFLLCRPRVHVHYSRQMINFIGILLTCIVGRF